MKKSLFLLLAMPLLFASCAKNEALVGESVEVSFTAELPAQTRAAGDLVVNKVVCATFENDVEIPALRKVIDIVDGQPIVYSPRLIKGKSYRVAFWAMKDGAYNVTDLKAVTVGDDFNGDPAVYECFTNSTGEFVVSGSLNVPVTLTRPLAKINFGISADEKTAVEALGYTLSKMSVEVPAVASYDALAQTTSSLSSKVMTLPIDGGTLTAGGSSYHALASYLVFTDGSNVDPKYSIYGQRGSAAESLIYEYTLNNVPTAVNHNTNVVGALMTGSVNYTVSMDAAYASSHNTNL